MNTNKKIAVVTGANRGLGLETSRQLAKQGILVILTSRNENKGKAAVAALQKEGLELIFHPLDVTKDESVEQLKNYLITEFGRVDILVNNAGIFPDSQLTGHDLFTAKIETLQTGIETNVYGIFRMCQALIPLMQKHNYGRVVNVSSGMGQLTEMNTGYPGYRISKTAVNAITKMFADQLKDSNILINSVCPGWVKTDMGGAEAPRSLEEGADTIVWLATLPDNSPSGYFWRDRQQINW